MNNNEILVRKAIEDKEREANSYEDQECYNAAYCYGYAAGATNALSALKQPSQKELFVILSHYSNENIGEFDRVGVHGSYRSLDAAKKAADAMLAKDNKENSFHQDDIPFTTDDCCEKGVFEEYPLYVAGQVEEGNFNSYHNIYAVFGVSLTGD